MTTPLTDASGQKFGDGLALIERVDTVKGEVPGASGDRQFRMYVRLTPNAREMLERSREFKRGVDNSVYHKGYPINYREQRGTPSIQVSIALDGRLADVDVDYRSSSFPVMLFNGHLSASNSDVRAGNNAERHAARWSGFQNWWRSFFGVGLERAPDAAETTPALALPKSPARGQEEHQGDGARLPAGVAGRRQRGGGDGLCFGTVLRVSGAGCARSVCLRPRPGAVSDHGQPESRSRRPRHARLARGPDDRRAASRSRGFARCPSLIKRSSCIYDVPDDVAARFDCASRLTPGAPTKGPRAYGHHFGTTFRIAGPRKDASIALLWAKEDGYWKIVSWQAEPEPDETPAPPAPPEPKVVRIKADLTLVQRGEELRGHLVDSQELRCRVSIPVDEKLRVLRPRAGS